MAPKTDARAVREREDVPVALDLLRCFRNTVRGEPPLRVELNRVGAPVLGGAVHRVRGNEHNRAFCNGDEINGTAISGT